MHSAATDVVDAYPVYRATEVGAAQSNDKLVHVGTYRLMRRGELNKNLKETVTFNLLRFRKGHL